MDLLVWIVVTSEEEEEDNVKIGGRGRLSDAYNALLSWSEG